MMITRLLYALALRCMLIENKREALVGWASRKKSLSGPDNAMTPAMNDSYAPDRCRRPAVIDTAPADCIPT